MYGDYGWRKHLENFQRYATPDGVATHNYASKLQLKHPNGIFVCYGDFVYDLNDRIDDNGY